jgi:hypothetical protein
MREYKKRYDYTSRMVSAEFLFAEIEKSTKAIVIGGSNPGYRFTPSIHIR